MKKTSKVLALVLAFVLAFSCVSTQAFAASAGNVKQYNSMVVLGDSIMRGCGLSGYSSVTSPEAMTGLTGSTPSLLAAECLTEGGKRCFCTFQGETLSSILCMLGLESESSDRFFTDTEASYGWFAKNVLPFMKDIYGTGGSFDLKENLKTAGLIVIELGMGDIFYRAKEFAMDVLSNGGELVNALAVLAKEITYGCAYVQSNYAKLLDYIKTNNPNADVVVVGLYNMLSGLSPIDGLYLPVFDAAAVVSGSVNSFLKSTAKRYGYMYADICDVPTPVVERNLSLVLDYDVMNMNIHPSIESGLPYMTRQIINVLPAASAEASQCKTTIKVDLGFVNAVDYVMVDGLLIKNFSLKGNVLTVPYLLPTASTVTVSAIDGTGKLLVQLYGLTYNLKTGYTAHRILSNSDVVGTVINGTKVVAELLGEIIKK